MIQVPRAFSRARRTEAQCERIADLATGLRHVGILVENMDDAVCFYESLGFEEAFAP